MTRGRTALTMACCLGLVTASAALGSARGQGALPPNPPRLAEMRHHFLAVTRIHEAIVRGNLSGLRVPATELAYISLPPEVPSSAAPYVAEVRRAGRRAAAATTLTAAARATVSMVTQCGECHLSVGVRPAPALPARIDGAGVGGQMAEHQRAADELLLGLVVPSADLWRQGADRLRAAALRPSPFPPDPDTSAGIRAAETRLRQIAERAARADTARGRADQYIQVLASCAGCHQLSRTPPGPRPAD